MSVLVDSSVWIAHLRGVPNRETAILDLLLTRRDPAFEHEEQEPVAELVVADPVLCEVLRGIPDPVLCEVCAASPIPANTRPSRTPY